MSEDARHMTRALELAARGEGQVEPNPMVGCVIARDGVCIGEGWHQRFGGPHAEVEALGSVQGSAAGATMYVTLEPCCHTGKTPPCTEAIVRTGIGRVVVAQVDPFPAVAGQGVQRLRDAGIVVDVGLLEESARQLNAPYRKLIQQQTPWIIAKWAMTLDGKLASRTGYSQWISSAASRQRVHQLRQRVDAVMVGRGTAQADDPLLTARPAGSTHGHPHRRRFFCQPVARKPLGADVSRAACAGGDLSGCRFPTPCSFGGSRVRSVSLPRPKSLRATAGTADRIGKASHDQRAGGRGRSTARELMGSGRD